MQDNNLSAPERLLYRQQHSVAVLGHIQTLLLAHLHAVVPAGAHEHAETMNTTAESNGGRALGASVAPALTSFGSRYR